MKKNTAFFVTFVQNQPVSGVRQPCEQYIKKNPQVASQFEIAITKLSSLLNELSKEPFKESMLPARERLLDVTKNQCASTHFKHWSTDSSTCDWNVCQCSHGLGPIEHKCPEHKLKACITCERDYQLVNVHHYTVHHPILGLLTIDKPVGDCKFKTCVCNGGNAKLGASCKSIGHHDCQSCHSGYQLINGKCVYKECKCSDGTGHRGASCHTQGSH